MALRFLSRGNCYGDDLDEIGSPLREQFLVAARDGSGREFSTPLEWREVCAAEMKEGTDLQGIEIWDAYDDDAADARFRLIYFPASDSGTLFHAGTARFAGLALWPDGFKQKHCEPATDVAALNNAWHARRG